MIVNPDADTTFRPNRNVERYILDRRNHRVVAIRWFTFMAGPDGKLDLANPVVLKPDFCWWFHLDPKHCRRLRTDPTDLSF